MEDPDFKLKLQSNAERNLTLVCFANSLYCLRNYDFIQHSLPDFIFAFASELTLNEAREAAFMKRIFFSKNNLN